MKFRLKIHIVVKIFQIKLSFVIICVQEGHIAYRCCFLYLPISIFISKRKNPNILLNQYIYSIKVFSINGPCLNIQRIMFIHSFCIPFKCIFFIVIFSVEPSTTYWQILQNRIHIQQQNFLILYTSDESSLDVLFIMIKMIKIGYF